MITLSIVYAIGFLLTYALASTVFQSRLGSDGAFVVTSLMWPVSLPAGLFFAMVDYSANSRWERNQPQPWENKDSRLWKDPASYNLTPAHHKGIVAYQEEVRKTLERAEALGVADDTPTVTASAAA